MQTINNRTIKTWSRLGQKGTVCGIALPEIMAEQNNVYVLTADLGHLSGLERIKKSFSSRYINVGIAEQNMIGIAAGIAMEGNIVYATTYATFLTMRCYEQIRHNLGYQNANVKLIGSAAGFVMGMSGNTHYSYEDISIMRSIPNITVISPADATEAYQALYAANQHEGPVYLRLTGSLDEKIIYSEPYQFEIGKANVLMTGSDVLLVATGNIVSTALEAARILENNGYKPAVINMHTIKPLDTDILEQYFNVPYIFSIEEHSIIGGLGSAIAEYIAESSLSAQLVRIGIPDQFVRPGNYEDILENAGLTAHNIYRRIAEKLG